MNEWEMSDEIEILLEKSQIEKLENKCIVVNLKNSFDVIIIRKSMTDKRISELEYIATENIQTISQRKKQRKKEQRIQYL